MYKSIKMSISGVSVVIKPTYDMSFNTYDLRSEGTGHLTRGILKKLNTLFNEADCNNTEVYDIDWEESVIKDVQGYNYQCKRVTPVFHDVDVIGYIEHYFFDGKNYITFVLAQDICCSMLFELVYIMKVYTNSFESKFSECKRFRNPSAKLENTNIYQGLKFKFKKARFEAFKGMKDDTNTVKICKKEVYTITQFSYFKPERAIAEIEGAEKDNNIKLCGLYYVTKIADSNGFEYSISGTYNNCYAFFTNSIKSFEKYVDVIR